MTPLYFTQIFDVSNPEFLSFRMAISISAILCEKNEAICFQNSQILDKNGECVISCIGRLLVGCTLDNKSVFPTGNRVTNLRDDLCQLKCCQQCCTNYTNKSRVSLMSTFHNSLFIRLPVYASSHNKHAMLLRVTYIM